MDFVGVNSRTSVFRIYDKQLFSSFFISGDIANLAFIKLSVTGKADVGYSGCTELTAFAKLIRSHRLRITLEYFFWNTKDNGDTNQGGVE